MGIYQARSLPPPRGAFNEEEAACASGKTAGLLLWSAAECGVR